MPEGLKPCPFLKCGGTAELNDDYESGRYNAFVECMECGARGTCFDYGIEFEAKRMTEAQAEAATAWNTRPREAALEAEVARLRELVELHPKAVEAAYREGYVDGNDGPNWRRKDTPVDELTEESWQDSDAKAALDAAGEATDA